MNKMHKNKKKYQKRTASSCSLKVMISINNGYFGINSNKKIYEHTISTCLFVLQ